jgi:hypothetical protein
MWGMRALVAVVALAASVRAWAAPCPPSAVVIGDDALVADVNVELRARGIGIDGGVPCTVLAEIVADGDHLRVTISDPDGRRVERTAANARTAATAIESWARRDVGDPLLEIHAVPTRTEPSAEVPSEVPSRAPSFEVGAALDTGVSGDGGLWSGGRARACVMVGGLCVGALVRFAVDTAVAGDTVLLESDRHALDLAVAVELPRDLGHWWIAPGAGVGQTSLTAYRDEPGAEEREQASAWFLHAGLAVGRRVGTAWRLRLDAGLAWAPLAASRLGEADGIDRQLASLSPVRGWLGLGVDYGSRAP